MQHLSSVTGLCHLASSLQFIHVVAYSKISSFVFFKTTTLLGQGCLISSRKILVMLNLKRKGIRTCVPFVPKAFLVLLEINWLSGTEPLCPHSCQEWWLWVKSPSIWFYRRDWVSYNYILDICFFGRGCFFCLFLFFAQPKKVPVAPKEWHMSSPELGPSQHHLLHTEADLIVNFLTGTVGETRHKSTRHISAPVTYVVWQC